jgi:hypothetical protein
MVTNFHDNPEMSQYSLSTDSIGPQHGSTVAIAGAQVSLNSTHADYVFSATGISDTVGIYTTLAPPHVIAQFENLALTMPGGVTAPLVAASLLPAAVRPLATSYVPIRSAVGGTAAWGMLKVATSGQMTMYHSPIESSGSYAQASTVAIDSFSGTWCTQAF